LSSDNEKTMPPAFGTPKKSKMDSLNDYPDSCFLILGAGGAKSHIIYYDV
jgi:hypothetical protein